MRSNSGISPGTDPVTALGTTNLFAPKAQSSGIKGALVADNYIESCRSEVIANDSVSVSVSVTVAMLAVVLHARVTSKEHALNCS